jgi:hypothetical protein
VSRWGHAEHPDCCQLLAAEPRWDMTAELRLTGAQCRIILVAGHTLVTTQSPRARLTAERPWHKRGVSEISADEQPANSGAAACHLQPPFAVLLR